MIQLKKYLLLAFPVIVVAFFSSCEKDIDIKVPQDDEKLVVEAYVCNLNASLNYVLISKTINYFNPDFSFLGIKNAVVKINEGTIIAPGDTTWKTFPMIASNLLPGYYSNDSLIGKVGYLYKLEISLNSEYYYSYTTMPEIVPIDSLTREVVNVGGTQKAFLSVHFNEPQSKGQNYRMMLRYAADPSFIAWGNVTDSNQDFFSDDNANGVYRHFTYLRTFNIGDTIQFYIGNMDRVAFNFWESYESARQNGGPFATPVQLKSNVKGKNVIGSFSGFAVSNKQIVFKL